MPHIYDFDHHLTNVYIPKISLEPYLPPYFVQSFKSLESRYIHKGRILNTSLVFQQEISSTFRPINFECLLTINEQICPCFMLDFLREIKLVGNEDQSFSLLFRIQNYKFLLPLEQFTILGLLNLRQFAYTEDFFS